MIITIKEIRDTEDQAGVSRLSEAYILSQDDRAEYIDWLYDEMKPTPDNETYREG